MTINSDSSQTKADIHITLYFSPVCGYLQLSQLRKWKVIQIFIVLHVFEIHFIKKIHCDSSKVAPGIFVLDISCLPELLNMCRLSSLLQHEIILILF